VQVIERILSNDKILHNLRVTPIFDESAVLYVVLEALKLS
jgi:hypothetical protein